MNTPTHHSYRLYRLNTGSCGGCDVEIQQAVAAASDLHWADSPLTADALLLTGPLLPAMRPALAEVLHAAPDIPLLAIGRCALDGHPFGRGGVRALPEIAVRLELDGCPPTPEEIQETIRAALQQHRRGRQ